VALAKTSSDDDTLIKSRLKKKISKSSRGSLFRGVSKNGKKWQVFNFTSTFLKINL
jgi:hypothetical protein